MNVKKDEFCGLRHGGRTLKNIWMISVLCLGMHLMTSILMLRGRKNSSMDSKEN
jgi:hypothetical protein